MRRQTASESVGTRSCPLAHPAIPCRPAAAAPGVSARPSVAHAKRPSAVVCRCAAAAQASSKAVALEEAQAELSGRTVAAAKPAEEPAASSSTVTYEENTGLPDVEEIFINNYYKRIEEADAPVVLIDFYTQWCGPCKLMYPKLCEMKDELKGQVWRLDSCCTCLSRAARQGPFPSSCKGHCCAVSTVCCAWHCGLSVPQRRRSLAAAKMLASDPGRPTM